ncbi:MAG: hypothetical protein WC732_09200 [Candidatus Omnitrophota bacterium]
MRKTIAKLERYIDQTPTSEFDPVAVKMLEEAAVARGNDDPAPCSVCVSDTPVDISKPRTLVAWK